MRIFFLLTAICISLAGIGQSAEQLRETARNFQRQGDYENAIMVLNKALALEPQNPDARKELVLAYYLSRKFDLAANELKPLLDRADADEQVFQIGGLIHRTGGNLKEADRIYKAGLKKFPNSGILYADYGEMFDFKDPGQGYGIKLWEKGIEVNPQFAGNYYHAAKYYSTINNPLRTLLLGEIFANLESYSARTVEIKNLLLDAVKRLFVYNTAPEKGKPAFENAVIEALAKQSSLSAAGITAESLTAIRTRFVLDWFNGAAAKQFPFRLFELHQQMLQDGLFEAYNQWLFGSAANLALYQSWTKNHAKPFSEFTKYQQGRILTIPAGQFYLK